MLLTLGQDALGQFYVNPFFSAQEREYVTCATNADEITPANNLTAVVDYINLVYNDDVTVRKFIDGTYDQNPQPITTAYYDDVIESDEKCETVVMRKYQIHRVFYHENTNEWRQYVLVINEEITLNHKGEDDGRSIQLINDTIYGCSIDDLPELETGDLFEVAEAEDPFFPPCAEVENIEFEYNDEFFAEMPPFDIYLRHITVTNKCTDDEYATMTKKYLMYKRLIINGLLPTVYYKDDLPDPIADDDIQTLKENGIVVNYCNEDLDKLTMTHEDFEHSYIPYATLRIYTIHNPYDGGNEKFSMGEVSQTLVPVPADVLPFDVYFGKDEEDEGEYSGGYIYLDFSTLEQGCTNSSNPRDWYRVVVTNLDAENPVGEEIDMHECPYTIEEGLLGDEFYEFELMFCEEGGKYQVDVYSAGCEDGIVTNRAVFSGKVTAEIKKQRLYTDVVSYSSYFHTTNAGVKDDFMVLSRTAHYRNLNGKGEFVASGTCSDLSYDNVNIRNNPSASICHTADNDWTYGFEIKGGYMTYDGSFAQQSYYHHLNSHFTMMFDYYKNQRNYRYWGEGDRDLATTVNTKYITSIGYYKGVEALMTDPRPIYYEALYCSEDPNEIIGPDGYGDSKMIAAKDRIDYRITFENDTSATSAAARVKVTCPLHPQADAKTVRLGQFGFGDYIYDVPEMSAYYNNRIDLADSLGVWLDVTAGYDLDNNEMYWIFQSIDPQTGMAPADSIGFLPVNDTLTGCGEGFVSFSVAAIESTMTGDTIAERADIMFDENDTIPTNVWTNIFDAVSPTSQLWCDTTGVHDNYILKFKALAADDENGSGVKDIRVYVNVDGTQYTSVGLMIHDTLSAVDTLTMIYRLGQGTLYQFVAQAIDNVGNTETFKSAPDFEFVNNNPPSDFFLTKRSFNEGDTIATPVGDFYAIDDQTSDKFYFTLVDGVGATDNDKFSIIDSLTLVTNYDFRCKDMLDFEIRVQCKDMGGDSIQKVFQIHAKETETPDPTIIEEEICHGESFFFGGRELTEDGVYTDTLATIHGCDSVVALVLSHLAAPKITLCDTTHCIYEDFDMPGFHLPWDSISQRLVSWTQDSDTLLMYRYDTINNKGCTDTMKLALHVFPQSHDYHHVYVCDNGMPFRYGDSTFYESGVKDVYFKSLLTGCDSIVTVTVDVNPTHFGIPVDTTICSNESFELFGQTFTEPGEYKVTGQTAIHHCDSTVFLTLHVNPISENYLDLTVCPTDLPMVYENFVITADMESGLYYDTLVAKNACDSIVTLDLTVRPTATQLNEFEGGWDWYSTFIDMTTFNVLDSLKKDLGDKGLTIKSQTQFLNYENGIWDGNLTQLANEQMYMIKTSDSVDINHVACYTNGHEHQITIREGWNHIGYVSRYANSLENALQTLTPADGDIIKSYDQGFSIYYSLLEGWYGSLTQLQPGVGYMYKSGNASDMILEYPEPARAQGRQMEMLPTYWNVTDRNFPDNMTFIGKITIDNMPATTENLEVGVFHNDEVRGSGRAIMMEGLGTYRLFIQVYGNQNDELTFKLYDHEHGCEYDATCYQKAYFAVNANYGTIHDPYVFKFYTDNLGVDEDESSREITLFPNPANSSTKVLLYGDFTAEERNGLTVEVLNPLGVKIQQVEPTRYPVQLKEIEYAGAYTVVVTMGTGRTIVKKLVVTR